MYILEQIRAIAAAKPDKLAMVADGRPLSYSQLWRLIEVCRRTLEPSAAPGEVAAVAVWTILDGWIIDLALRSLGMDAVVFFTPEGAAAVAEMKPRRLITVAGMAAPLGPVAGIPGLELTAPSRQALDETAPLPPLPAKVPPGGHYLLTSGTTGQPRGVLSRLGGTEESMAGLNRMSRELADDWDAPPGEGVLNHLDLALWTGEGYTRTVQAWCNGDAVVTHQRDGFHGSLGWPGLTRTVATPYHLVRLMALPEGAFPYCPDMKLTVSAGSMSPTLAREVRRRLTPRLVINLGATEGGIWARSTVKTDEDLSWYRVLPGRRVEVVDEADLPLPPGSLGRVRVGMGQDSSTGHLGDPEASAKPFANGWFYPGDLGVLDGQGRLALRGRTTDVVNINGDKFPTEPWERTIQDKLNCDGVCILAGAFEGEDDRIHVFIEARQPIGLDLLTETLRSTLYGFPDVQVHKIDALPRTPLGKIRRFELARLLHRSAPSAGAPSKSDTPSII